ncbi:hypothetical protein CAN33_0027515 [Aspergillus niger]|uniref:Probable transporter MCH1 n=1 Tax=Aspergillus niger TaxID=5061 RepID=A0A505I2D0_ASPNG|nr:hypothetical protein CAN33_0027515 [Aspergillus niger]
MTPSRDKPDSAIDKRDFDAHRPLLDDADAEADEQQRGHLRSRPQSCLSATNNDDGLLNDVVDEILERDRKKMAKEVVRVSSFAWGVISCLGAGSITAFSLYGPLLLTRLHYTQLRVNAVAIAAEVSMYLPVPLFGYLCDRYSPSPLALFSGFVFGAGYLLAALAFKSGPPPDAGGDGWPFWVMIVAFIAIGVATSCMYLAAVATCAKNFGRGKHKGIMLAVPIAGFGLSGMWQSQVGTYFLCDRLEDGTRGDVNVYKYFLFLAILLFCVGVIGTFALRIVDENEDKYIDEAVEELERSGLLEESEFFRPRNDDRTAYGTFSQAEDGTGSDGDQTLTLIFLQDKSMWWLAIGFFLVTGPGEAYINNLGTIVQSLTPVSNITNASSPAGLPSTHVSTIALTSTIARLLTGSLSDLFAPPATHLFPALIGLGYGSAFSLVPIIISVVWGVENFATNWGIVAMVPAAGAVVWGLVYSQGYQDAMDDGNGTNDGQCHGWRCFGFWAVGCTVSVWIAIGAWLIAWRYWRRRGVVV